MSAHYLIRPKADQDLEEQAFYLAHQAGSEIGHRFLLAAHETFTLLASNPGIGWRSRLKHPQLTDLRFFRITGFEKNAGALSAGFRRNRNPPRNPWLPQSYG